MCHVEYLHIFICCLSKIQIQLGILHFHLLNLAPLDPRYASDAHGLGEHLGGQHEGSWWLRRHEHAAWNCRPPALHLQDEPGQSSCCKDHLWGQTALSCRMLYT